MANDAPLPESSDPGVQGKYALRKRGHGAVELKRAVEAVGVSAARMLDFASYDQFLARG